MAVLSKDNGVALYAQVRESLRNRIVNGSYQPGERLPAEEALTAEFGVSRMTVRQGISDLLDEGLLYRKRGIGTFVAQRHVHRDHNRLTTFFDSAESESFEARIAVLKQEVLLSRHLVARSLNILEGEPVFHIQTLRFADGLPITLHDEFIPYKLCPEMLDHDFTQVLSWEALERCGFRIKQAVQRVEAIAADGQTAKLLETEIGAPLLYKERTVVAEDGTPLEFALCYNRGDRYSLTTTLTR